MGTKIELNDTLLLSTQQGFPADKLDFEVHRESPVSIEQLRDHVFQFKEKDGARLFHLDPVRVYLVHNIDGKWLHWGHALILSQTIGKQLRSDGNWTGEWVTSGTYKIVKILAPEYQMQFTRHESPSGKSFFD